MAEKVTNNPATTTNSNNTTTTTIIILIMITCFDVLLRYGVLVVGSRVTWYNIYGLSFCQHDGQNIAKLTNTKTPI